MTESKNRNGATQVEVDYIPGHDEFVAKLSLVSGRSEYVEEIFVDCLGNSNVFSSVDCKVVSEFSK